MTQSVKQWKADNADNYANVEARLTATREKFLSVERVEQIDMLHKSRAFAILSIRTKVHKHEIAYIKWLQDGEVSKESMYHNQKAEWLQDMDRQAYNDVIDMLEDGNVRDAWLEIVDKMKGLSHTKAAFTLAMLGFTDYMCIDSNMKNRCNVDMPKRTTPDTYEKACRQVHGWYSHLDMSAFLTQWCVFDAERGVHSTHRVWFDSVGTWDL
ncbi:endonuclease III [Haloarcula tailed virus 2]|uniref:Endonuclease III n=1 Tax=Haloarcula tailed virus 2 TaxID=2877989 RepID=A0AAE8Y0Q0_9CAUD|nr:endonuclease III [Haloarcula tailed virus 2]UBF23269.1 endonuclease III [Haloarcula tailed virus 2]